MCAVAQIKAIEIIENIFVFTVFVYNVRYTYAWYTNTRIHFSLSGGIEMYSYWIFKEYVETIC